MRTIKKRPYYLPSTTKRGRFERDLKRLTQTQTMALLAAKAQLLQSGGGEVVVHTFDGRVTQTLVVQERRPSPHYRMEIEWSSEDDAYVVTVPELPGCMTHGSSYAEAAAKGENAISSWLAAARHWGTPIPTPREAVMA